MKKVQKIFANVSAMTMGAMTLPVTALAADWLENPAKQEELSAVIKMGLNTAIVFAAVVAVFFLIYNGFQYMISGGDPAKVEKAQKGIANAVIGLVIAIVAAILVNYILGLFGAEPGNVDNPGS